MMQNKNEKVVSCPPCGEQPLAPEGFNPGGGLPTKRGFLNKKTSFATPLPAYGVLPPQGGQITSHGFTLIELLVVVLIIGILAAVALPQYQKAVTKSRISSLMPIGKAIADSNEVYYMEHGSYAQSLSDLLVQGQASYPDGTQVNLVDDDDYSYTLVSNTVRLPNHKYIVFQKHSTKFAGTTMCEAADETAGKICESLGGTSLEGGVTSGWTAYLLSGNSGDSSFGPQGTVFDGKTVNHRDGLDNVEGNVTFDNGGTCNANGFFECSSQNDNEMQRNFTFDNGSQCLPATSGCNGNTYDHGSSCGTDGANACNNSTFKNNSKCYAYGSNNCSGTYDATSSCEGPGCPTNCTDNGDGTRTCRHA